MLSNWSAILNWIDFYTLACWKKLTSKVDVSLVKKNFKKKLQPIVSKNSFLPLPSFFPILSIFASSPCWRTYYYNSKVINPK